jgi:hypothetical protein
MFVKSLGKTDMVMFWQFMFEFCNNGYYCLVNLGIRGSSSCFAGAMMTHTLIEEESRRRHAEDPIAKQGSVLKRKPFETPSSLIKRLASIPKPLVTGHKTCQELEPTVLQNLGLPE